MILIQTSTECSVMHEDLSGFHVKMTLIIHFVLYCVPQWRCHQWYRFVHLVPQEHVQNSHYEYVQ